MTHDEASKIASDAARTFAQTMQRMPLSDIELAVAINHAPGIHDAMTRGAAEWSESPEAAPIMLAVATAYAQAYYRARYGGDDPLNRI